MLLRIVLRIILFMFAVLLLGIILFNIYDHAGKGCSDMDLLELLSCKGFWLTVLFDIALFALSVVIL